MKLFENFDFPLFIFSLLVFSLGAFALLSTDQKSFMDQLIFFAVGIALYFAFSFLDYSRWKNFLFLFYVISIILLICVLFLGHSVRGAKRWFNLGSFYLQPSEFSKLGVITLLSSLLAPLERAALSLKRIIVSFLLILPIVLLVAVQPDLGSALVILGTWLLVILFSGLSWRYLLISLIVISSLSYPAWGLLKDYQKERIVSFINPYADPLGSGYNVIQSVVAVGSGKVLGRGFGRGTQSHLRFLPEYRTDFIFAAFSEEWGLVGSVLLLLIYSGLLLRILEIAKSSKTDLESLLCVGVFSLLIIQFAINVGMNLGILPVTGVTLPLVSYGGSSLVVTFILLGIVQGVARKPLQGKRSLDRIAQS